ncbi:o-succinylbenzoate--CoA ligase [Staphylococcus edaphicus]|uniref:2-succinylbenzoate--CoA ligase n=1 Tax=Staphylococcus edaphicus TaxID=1955013 RepID=A0A2C6WRX7_9STAP|nr:o-succinylbenzoate--CoA ligase [Staphylococcus edaphicus]PHK50845.1 o-succinylbenzoate--CoA ligase [Staphylococcus edaphicus]UQW82537.1 o-succinylbenzoate--CoA ligase [Staphylococcus edaphicus]
MDFWLKQQAKQNGECVFVDDGEHQITFESMYDDASKLAWSLQQLNRKRIGFYIDNTIEAVLLVNAAWIAGIEIAMVNTRLTKHEMIAQMDSINVDTVIAMNELELEHVRVLKFDELQAINNNKKFEGSFSLERIASIMFTSGTTGPQKAVPQTFNNHLASAVGCKESLGFDKQTKWLSVLPIYHISGLSVVLRALIEGFTLRIASKFDTDKMLDIIKNEAPTHVSLVPQTLKWLMDGGLHQPFYIEKILLGGAKLSRSLITQALEYHLPIYNSFGMTETCSQFLTATPDMLLHRFDTVGKPSNDVQIKIKDPNEAGHGELLIKGANVMDGYLYPKNKRDTFENGYFKTGDIAKIDEAGYVMIYDRRKDLIISGGENIYPYQIETVAKLHPNIEDAMCIGVEDETWGAVPYLYYVANEVITEAHLTTFFEKKLAKFKIPKQFQRVPTLPYTSTGKLQRTRL